MAYHRCRYSSMDRTFGDTTTRWDNGFYVDCTVLNIKTAFLVDSGSTATLVPARVFQSIQPDKRPLLVKITDKVRGANGGNIEVLGIADIQLKLGGVCFCQTTIVCDILPDGIPCRCQLKYREDSKSYDPGERSCTSNARSNW